MEATVVKGMLAIRCVDILPDGVSCLTVDLPAGDVDGWAYSSYEALPVVVRFQGRQYSKAGWNSDRGVAYYHTGGRNVAEVVRA